MLDNLYVPLSGVFCVLVSKIELPKLKRILTPSIVERVDELVTLPTTETAGHSRNLPKISSSMLNVLPSKTLPQGYGSTSF